MARKEKTPKGGWETYISALVTEIEPIYTKRNETIQLIHQHRMMEKSPIVPAQFQKAGIFFKGPLVFDLLRRINALISAYPKPKRVPLNAGDQENSSHIEKWLSAIYGQLFKNTYNSVKDALIAEGTGVFKVILAKNLWGGLEADPDADASVFNDKVANWRKSRIPFRAEHVASSTYYPIGDGKEEVLEITQRQARPLARQYGLVPSEGKLVKPRDLGVKDPEQVYPNTVKFVEYWNKYQYVYLVDGIVVEKGIHNYGRVPYFVCRATTTSSKDPSENGISFAFPLVSLQEAINQIVTMRMNWEYLNSFPSFNLIPITEEAMSTFPENEMVVEIRPGEVNKIPAGHKLEPMQAPSAGPGLVALQQFVMGMADQVSLAPVLSGTPPGADTSQAALTTVATIAKSMFGPAIDSLAYAFDDCAEFILEIVDNKFGEDEPISVYDVENKKGGKWLSLKPSDIKGYYKIFHTINAVIPAELFQKGQVLTQAYTNGIVSMRYTREEGYGIEAPEEMDDERFVEDFLKWPEVRQMLAQKFMEQVQGVPAQPQQPTMGGTQPVGNISPAGPGAPMNPQVM